MRDSFYVNVEDLPNGSAAQVEVLCDYCGARYSKSWYNYIKAREHGVEKDCCSNAECTSKKAVEVTNLLYGAPYTGQLPSFIEKRKATCIKRYGVENPFAAECVKEKIISTNMKKYGVPYCTQNPTVAEKYRQTCMERYGVENYFYLLAGAFIKENSPKWKGGVEHSRVERATYEYHVWRRAVFERDLFRCQACGAKNGDGIHHGIVLNAHHIKNWKDNPDDRYDVNNDITLCDECHKLFHKLYGKAGTTVEQLNDFLADEKVC